MVGTQGISEVGEKSFWTKAVEIGTGLHKNVEEYGCHDLLKRLINHIVIIGTVNRVHDRVLEYKATIVLSLHSQTTDHFVAPLLLWLDV